MDTRERALGRLLSRRSWWRWREPMVVESPEGRRWTIIAAGDEGRGAYVREQEAILCVRDLTGSLPVLSEPGTWAALQAMLCMFTPTLPDALALVRRELDYYGAGETQLGVVLGGALLVASEQRALSTAAV